MRSGSKGGQFPAQIRGGLQARSLSIAGPAARGCCAGPATTETSERDAWHSPGVLAQPIWCSTDVRSNFRISDLGPSLLLRHRGLTADYVAADSPASFWKLNTHESWLTTGRPVHFLSSRAPHPGIKWEYRNLSNRAPSW